MADNPLAPPSAPRVQRSDQVELPPWRFGPRTAPVVEHDAVGETAVNFGALVFVISQLYSRSYPETAKLLSENLIGPEIVAGKGHFRLTANQGVLLFAPQPVGLVPPQEYGLRPNYLRPVNNLLGNPLPESHFLKTQRDLDPAVLEQRRHAFAIAQVQHIEAQQRNLSTNQLLQIYALATGPRRNELFGEPELVQKSIAGAVEGRLGFAEGGKALFEARTVQAFGGELPATGQGSVGIPQPVDAAQLATQRLSDALVRKFLEGDPDSQRAKLADLEKFSGDFLELKRRLQGDP